MKKKSAREKDYDIPAVDDRDDLVPPSHRPHHAQVLDRPLHGL